MELPVIEKAEGRVLSTLEADGRRRWLTPRLAQGHFWHQRRIVAYALIAIYALLPWIYINGRPALQIDLWNGRFSFFGLVFLPSELRLLALFGLVVVLSVFFATAVFGRVWCGWGCPQTVYLEYVFRPIERFFTGTTGKGGLPKKPVAGWRKLAMYVVFLLICWHLANTFLAYFVGARTLNGWIWNAAPWEHPAALMLVLFVTGLMMFDFCYWREQLCIIGCPYGRFQSVMLDDSSLVVGYDKVRGEPRGRGRDREDKGLGDCVDCNMCVEVCPTGIDIRDGLQMECVNCTQCIDACDEVMRRTNQPLGLIRYSAQGALEGKSTRVIRPRLIVYITLITLLVTLLVTLLATRSPMHVTLLREMGRPYTQQGDEVLNIVRVKVVNRTDKEMSYTVAPASDELIRIEGETEFTIPPQEMTTHPVQLIAKPESFAARAGVLEVEVNVTDSEGASITRSYRMQGPMSAP